MFTYRNLLSNQAETYDRRSMENPHALYVGQSGDAMKNEIKSFITNFPIPSAKDDLLEFITSMAARRSGIHNDYEDAYRAKLNESINKAKLYFPDDPQFAPLIERFTKLSFENLPSGGKMGVILAGLMVAAFIIGLIGQCAGLS